MTSSGKLTAAVALALAGASVHGLAAAADDAGVQGLQAALAQVQAETYTYAR